MAKKWSGTIMVPDHVIKAYNIILLIFNSGIFLLLRHIEYAYPSWISDKKQ